MLDFCTFTEAPALAYATLTTLSLDDSALQRGLHAPDMECRGSLYLRKTRSRGTLDLVAAKIGGQLNCKNATLDGKGGKALNAQGLEVAQGLFLDELSATGTVDVNAAKIGVQFSGKNAILDGKGGEALNAQGLEVAQSLFLDKLSATGTVDVNAAKIGGQFSCENATLDGKGGEALNAHRLEAAHSLFLNELSATGTVDVAGAKIGGQFSGKNAILDGNGGKALNAQGLEVAQGLLLDELSATGTVYLGAAKIGGQFNCMGARLDGAGTVALHAERLYVAQSFFFCALGSVKGDVSFISAQVGDLVDDLASWEAIEGEVALDGFTYERIVAAPTDAATRLRWLETGATCRGKTYPQPYTQLAKVLAGMGHARAARLVLHRRAQRMAEQDHRLALARLADLRRQSGQASGPAALEAARRADRHWAHMAATRVWMRLLDRLIGYGHRPEFAALWAGATYLLAVLVYWIAYEYGGMAPGSAVVLLSQSWAEAMRLAPDAPALVWVTMPEGLHYETFAALPYALDVVLPIVDLGQQSAWMPSTTRWIGTLAWAATWGFILFGWMLSALLVAALTGLIQKGQAGADQ